MGIISELRQLNLSGTYHRSLLLLVLCLYDVFTRYLFILYMDFIRVRLPG